jgi:hypothetical protein
VCVDGTTYLWADDEEGGDWTDFAFDVNSVPGASATLGACPTAPRPPDTMPDCSNKFQVQPDFHQIGDPNVFPDSFTFVPPYRSPYAVPVSKVPDSGNPLMSNLAGSFVEVCNLDTGFTPGVKPTQTFVDLDGNPIPPVAPYVSTDPKTGKLVPKPGILEVAS